jgi:hypothetical protein
MAACVFLDTSSNIETIKLLIKHNADLIIQDNDGKNALIHICPRRIKNMDIIKLLINDVNIDLNLKDSNGDTALMLFCMHNGYRKDIIKLFIKNGTNTNIINNMGWNVLFYITLFSHKDNNLESFHLLLKHSTDCSIQDINGKNVLMILCRPILSGLNTKMIRLLLDYDDSIINLIDKKKYNSLMYLCKFNKILDKEEIKIAKLIKSKTDLNHRDFENKKVYDNCLEENKFLF